MTDHLESLLRRGLAATQAPEDWSADELAVSVLRRRRRLLRRRLALSLVMAAVCGSTAFTTWAVTSFGTHTSANSTSAAPPALATLSPPTSAEHTTAEGTLVGAFGAIVNQAGHRPVLCKLGGTLAVLRNTPGNGDRFPPTCLLSIPLAGLPATDLPPVDAMRYAYVEGRLDGGILNVTKVQDTDPWSRPLDIPPCPTPAGGWPQGDNLDLGPLTTYQQRHTDTVIAAATFRPGGTGLALVVAANDVAAVRTALAPIYGRALCVVQSRYSAQQVTAAETRLQQMVASNEIPGELGVSGVGLAADGQPVVTVTVLADTPTVRQALADFPAGLVTVDAWLHPAPSS